MQATGIICELNPMHKGHFYLVQEAKKRNQAVVGVMSGPFVQRGEPAIMDKWDRARIAIMNGFDLIIELPQVYALQSAKWFALGGIKTLSLITGIDNVTFASEPGWDIEALHAYQNILRRQTGTIDQKPQVDKSMNTVHKELTAIEVPANAKLGLAYLQAIQEEHLGWPVHIVERQGAHYHDDKMSESYPSATAIRKVIRKEGVIPVLPYLAGGTKVEDFPPHLPLLDDLRDYIEIALILDNIDFSRSAHFEPGMDNRLVKSIQEAHNLEEAFLLASNKKHSISRYRRLILTSILGIGRVDKAIADTYCRPLAFNDIGRELLKQVKVPIVQKLSQVKLDKPRSDILAIDVKAQQLYEWLSQQKIKRDYQATFYYQDF